MQQHRLHDSGIAPSPFNLISYFSAARYPAFEHQPSVMYFPGLGLSVPTSFPVVINARVGVHPHHASAVAGGVCCAVLAFVDGAGLLAGAGGRCRLLAGAADSLVAAALKVDCLPEPNWQAGATAGVAAAESAAVAFLDLLSGRGGVGAGWSCATSRLTSSRIVRGVGGSALLRARLLAGWSQNHHLSQQESAAAVFAVRRVRSSGSFRTRLLGDGRGIAGSRRIVGGIGSRALLGTDFFVWSPRNCLTPPSPC